MGDNDSRGEGQGLDPWTQGQGASPQAEPVSADSTSWEREAISKLAGAALAEQRRARRWGIFFKLLAFAYVGFTLFMVWQMVDPSTLQPKSGKHSAVIDIDGTIAANEEASASQITAALKAAYADPNTAGVILRINSPGGSPVQAGIIYDELRRRREQHPEIPIYAVLGDICASGGYYVAAAADRIYADKATIVGSIGVRMDSFGFVGAMELLGVERRLLTAGKNKGLLDPFSPVDPSVTTHLQGLLNEIHQQFIDAVRTGRGDRLGDSPELFSGLIWSGDEGVRNGLVDALGNDAYVAREVIGAERLVNFTARKDLINRFAERIGATMLRIVGGARTPQLDL